MNANGIWRVIPAFKGVIPAYATAAFSLICLSILGSASTSFGTLGPSAASAQQASPEPAKLTIRQMRRDTETYEDLLRKVKATDSGVSFREFRLAYADSAQYKPNSNPELRKTMFGALSAKDYAKAAEVADAILEDRFVDIYGHQVAAVAYRELGDRAKASVHGSIARNLVQSIVESGDGSSPETAMLLISEDEESVILQALSLKMVGQELLDQGGHTYDRVEAMEPGEGHVTLYFNLDVPVIKMREALDALPE